MNVPQVLRDNVLRIFHAEGRQWLDRLPRLLRACREKWNLSDCTLSADMSINFVAFARSPDFGRVVLKVGVPHPEFFTEVRALSLYGGTHACRCYDWDADLGAMILERIFPGQQLSTLCRSRDRTAVAAGLASALLCPPGHDHGLPLLSDLAGRAFERIRGEERAGSAMLCLVDAAEGLLREAGPRGGALLHGDLHHYNILRDGPDNWKAIDPKGLIGPAPVQVSRFIINELDLLRPSEWRNGLDEMVGAFGARLRVSEPVIAGWAFFDKVLSTCWMLEEDTDDDRGDDVKQCRFLMQYWLDLRGS